MSIYNAIDEFLEFNADHIKPEYKATIHQMVKEKFSPYKWDGKVETIAVMAIVKYNIEPIAAIQYAIERVYKYDVVQLTSPYPTKPANS